MKTKLCCEILKTKHLDMHYSSNGATVQYAT